MRCEQRADAVHAREQSLARIITTKMGIYSVGSPKGARISHAASGSVVKMCTGPAWQQCVAEATRLLPDGEYVVSQLTDAVSSFENMETGTFEHWAFMYALSRRDGVTVTLGPRVATGMPHRSAEAAVR